MGSEMSQALGEWLARFEPQVEELITWNTLRLRVRSYCVSDLPPDEFITSVRAVVCDEKRVLMVRDPESVHILPGGRREPSETLEQTLRREVLEETGWEIANLHMLGIKHFHHLSPKPAGYTYPYPDFLQVIYLATPERYDASSRQTTGYELDAVLAPHSDLEQLHLSPGERLFLQAALQKLHS